MKITITPEGDVTFDVDLSNGHVDEAIELMQKVQRRAVSRDTLAAIRTMPAAIVAQKQAKAKRTTPVPNDRTSRYYSVPRKRNFAEMAEFYDYIAAFVNGRTTDQLVDHFGIGRQTSWSRTHSLQREMLIYQPNGRGSAWVAMN